MSLKKISTMTFLAALSVAAAEFSLQDQENRLGWFFAPGEQVNAALKLDQPQQEAPQLLLTDFFGNQSKIPVEFTPGGNSVRFRIPTDRQGYFVVSAPDLKLNQPLAVTPDNSKIATPASPFGCNFHLTRISYNDAVREVEIARRAGFGWIRGGQFDWSSLKKREDMDQQFQRFAQLNEYLRNCGLGVLGSIHYVAQYASGAPEGSNYNVWSRVAPTNWSDLTEFAARYAKECDFINHWELMNEPDAELFWRGSWENWTTNNDRGIIRDAVTYHAAGGTGIKASNPRAKILYLAVTSAIPEGATYRPFLKETLDAGIASNFDIMNLHYTADIAEVRKLLAPYDAADRPVWVTEIGTHSAAGSSERLQLIREIAMQIEQLAHGASKVFKYDLRNDGTTGYHEDNFGLIRRDFSPKPNFVAHSTMIRLLHDARAAGLLNIVDAADAGYCRGYSFDSASGGSLNVVQLYLAPRATVTLSTPEKQLIVTDVMGNSQTVDARNGKITLEMDDLPLFITGKITGAPGEPVYPGDVTVRTYPMTPQPLLPNGSFEEGSKYWGNTLGKVGKVEIVTGNCVDGDKSLALTSIAPGPKNFLGLAHQKIDLRKLTGPLAENEYASFKLTGFCRRENLVGRGVNIGVNYYDDTGKRIRWRESPYRAGSHDWCPVEVSGDIPKETVTMNVVCNVAPQTTGTVMLDNLSLTIEIRRKPDVKKKE